MPVLFPVSTRIIAVAATLLALASMAACSSSSGGAASSSPTAPAIGGGSTAAASSAQALLPSSIRDKGTLVVGSEIDYPPFDDYDANKKPWGLDFDLVNAAAGVLRLKVDIENIQVPSLIPSLQTGRIDMATDGFFITAERLKVVDFVKTYKATNSLLVTAGNPHGLTGSTTCGKEIAIEAGTQEVQLMDQASDICAKDGKPKPIVTTFPTLTAQTLAIESGRVEAGPMGTAPAEYVAKTAGGKLAVAPGLMPGGSVPIGIMVQKGSKLGQALTAAMQALVKDGSYAKILQKYGVSGSAISPELAS